MQQSLLSFDVVENLRALIWLNLARSGRIGSKADMKQHSEYSQL